MKLIILTKSSKHRDLCVAGIECDSGKWVRLVSDNVLTDGAITHEDLLDENNREADIFDVINVETLREDPTPIQPENVLIDKEYYVSIERSTSLREALMLHGGFDMPEYIYGNPFAYIYEDEVKNLGYSLIIVDVQDLTFYNSENVNGQKKTKARFRYNGVDYSDMSVTDPNFYNIKDGTTYRKAALIITIGQPYNGKHYKFIAAIYPNS